jgi:hypothetical protein
MCTSAAVTVDVFFQQVRTGKETTFIGAAFEIMVDLTASCCLCRNEPLLVWEEVCVATGS